MKGGPAPAFGFDRPEIFRRGESQSKAVAADKSVRPTKQFRSGMGLTQVHSRTTESPGIIWKWRTLAVNTE